MQIKVIGPPPCLGDKLFDLGAPLGLKLSRTQAAVTPQQCVAIAEPSIAIDQRGDTLGRKEGPSLIHHQMHACPKAGVLAQVGSRLRPVRLVDQGGRAGNDTCLVEFDDGGHTPLGIAKVVGVDD